MIREITAKDIPSLLAYGARFWEDTPYVHQGIEYSPESVENLIRIMKDSHYLRVYEAGGKIVGLLGIFLAPMHFNTNYNLGTEIFFYVHPDYRGTVGRELITRAEEDLKDQVDILSFGDMDTSKDMKEYYRGYGFKPTENTYTKVLI